MASTLTAVLSGGKTGGMGRLHGWSFANNDDDDDRLNTIKERRRRAHGWLLLQIHETANSRC